MKKVYQKEGIAEAVLECRSTMDEIASAMSTNSEKLIKRFLELNGTTVQTPDHGEVTYYKFTAEESDWVGGGLSFNQMLAKNNPTLLVCANGDCMLGYDEYEFDTPTAEELDDLIYDLGCISDMSTEDIITFCLSLTTDVSHE